MTTRPSTRQTPRPMAAGHVIVVVVLALLGGAILNAQALTDAAARQPFGWKRTAAVVAATPFRGIAGLVGLDRPHAVLAEAASGAIAQPGVEEEAAEAASAPVTPEPSPQPVSPTETAAPSEEPTEVERAAPSRRDPLLVWVGGDSLTSEFGPALADRLAQTQRAKAIVEFRFSSGLSRPDFFDWPARLAQVAQRQDPDVFVVMFGANDGQNIAVGGEVLEFASDEWTAEYAERVASVMDALATHGRTVYWGGQPIMRAPDFDAKMQLLNDIYRAQARRREDVVYIDTRDLFAADGAFAAYLEDAQGQSVLMRQQDGVHLTRAGGERLTDVVIDMIDDRWPLTE